MTSPVFIVRHKFEWSVLNYDLVQPDVKFIKRNKTEW